MIIQWIYNTAWLIYSSIQHEPCSKTVLYVFDSNKRYFLGVAVLHIYGHKSAVQV